MSYDTTLSIKLPAALADIAAMIGRAMDVDTGGERSFTRIVTGMDAEGKPIYGDTISTTTPCTTAFKAQAEAMMANPALLHGAVAADYAKWWENFTPPTLIQCKAFCNGIIPEPSIIKEL
jgi:hypothetical protein